MIVENRWSWGRLLAAGVGLFLVYNAVMLYLYDASEWLVAGIDAVIALISLGITWWTLKSFKLFSQRPKFSRSMKIWGLIALVTVMIMMILNGFFQNLPLLFGLNDFWLITVIALATGIFEETLCRGLFFSVFLDHALYNGSSFRFTRSAIYSAVLFGGFHFVNFLGGNPAVVFQQMFWAFVLGVFLAALRVATNTLVWGILLHFLLDWVPSISGPIRQSGSSWWELIAVFGPIFIASLIFLVYTDQRYREIPAENA